MESNWHSLKVKETASHLKTDLKWGLSHQEVRRRLAQYGPNRLPSGPQRSPWLRFLDQFRDLLIYVLLATAGISLALGEFIDAAVIMAVVIINAVIGFVQESQAEAALLALKEMLSPKATVIREGQVEVIPAEELVPGDLITLAAGAKVPADARVIWTKGLLTNEAALTGESLPVEKTADPLPPETPLAERRNMVYSGTLVVAGEGQALVVATGEATEFGQIAKMMATVETPKTPLTRKLEVFSRKVTFAILAFAALTFLLGYFRKLPFEESFMAAVALAVSAIPEGLPVIMTVALAIGVKRMARRGAIIRYLPSVETLGSTTVICTDKTGTLTRNEMTVVKIILPDRREIKVEGVGYAPHGRLLLGKEAISAEADLQLKRLLLAGLLCNQASLIEKEGQWLIDGDPTEGALIVVARKAGLDEELRTRFPRLDLLPFDSDRQFMVSLHEIDGQEMAFIKGAPEKILPLTGEEELFGLVEELARSGLRVLAVAERKLSPPLTEKTVSSKGWRFLGLLAMIDPARPEAAEAISLCHRAGITVKMATGDHPLTAQAIGHQLGLKGRVVEGRALEDLEEKEFSRIARQTDIFARVTPAIKLRLVQALKAQREIVAMTGDGVNDAPALKAADIGIAMGSGTDVAKEASDMVITDDNFASIVAAVEEGRTVFDNLRKTILFIFPTNGGECLLLLGAIALATTLPVLPLHILWINLVTTVALAVALAFEPREAGVMDRPPRPPQAPLLEGYLIRRMALVSILMAAFAWGGFEWWFKKSLQVEEARALAVNMIVFFEAFYLLNCRRLLAPVVSPRDIWQNQAVVLGLLAILIFQLAFTYLPFFNKIFSVRPFEPLGWLVILTSGMIFFVLIELEKALSRSLKRGRK
ncbi:cation-translocating P-type ATPase [Thermosulfuriphilus sp.]